MQGQHRILYTGELMPGRALQEVVPLLAAKFKLNDGTARDLILGGSGRVLKQGLTREEAQRYRSALNAVGLRVTVEPALPPPQEGSDTESAAVPQSASTASNTSSDADSVLKVGAGISNALSRSDRPETSPGFETRCPKCGAHAVSELTGVCRACGVVVDRYLSNQATSRQGERGPVDDPYAVPLAGLTPPRVEDGPDHRLDAPTSRPARNGWLWITQAWALFKRQPGAWIGALIIFYVIIIGLGMVPLAGGLAVTILSPMLSAGLMIGASQQHRFGRFEIGHLFAGVSRCPGPLALLGLVYLLLAIAIVVIAGLIVAGVLASLADPFAASAINPNDLDLFLATPLLLLPVLGATLLFVPLAMAVFFAPSLIALDQIPVLDACRLSFLGCLKNILPFSIFGLIAMVMVVVGSIPLLLGLLIVFPVLTIAVYMAYRDIFYSAGSN